MCWEARRPLRREVVLNMHNLNLLLLYLRQCHSFLGLGRRQRSAVLLALHADVAEHVPCELRFLIKLYVIDSGLDSVDFIHLFNDLSMDRRLPLTTLPAWVAVSFLLPALNSLGHVSDVAAFVIAECDLRARALAVVDSLLFSRRDLALGTERLLLRGCFFGNDLFKPNLVLI